MKLSSKKIEEVSSKESRAEAERRERLEESRIEAKESAERRCRCANSLKRRAQSQLGRGDR